MPIIRLNKTENNLKKNTTIKYKFIVLEKMQVHSITGIIIFNLINIIFF